MAEVNLSPFSTLGALFDSTPPCLAWNSGHLYSALTKRSASKSKVLNNRIETLKVVCAHLAWLVDQ